MTPHDTHLSGGVHATSARPAATWHRWVAKSLVFAQLLVVLLMAKNCAYAGIYRLYLDRRVGSADRSMATQRFDVEGGRVVPRIVTRAADRVAFETAIGQDVSVHVGVRPLRRASYAIEWRNPPSPGLRQASGTVRQVLAHGTVDAPADIICPFPTGSGILELVADDALAWVDPRLVRTQPIGPPLAALIVLVMMSLAWTRRLQRAGSSIRDSQIRVLWFKVTAVGISTILPLVVSEIALRAMGDAAPRTILAERQALGELVPDERWEDSPRYGRRLRRNVDVLTEWRHGDIVRMGYIPPPVSEWTVHRFRVQTDAEGFRNRATRERFDVAALGDSFTDAMTLPVEASWPMQLQERLGVAVQNYGTAGFGPQQELLALQDFVAPHRPRVVVQAFFAGNDIFDAEAFDEFQRSGGSTPRAPAGWRIKDVVSEADTWYVVNALHAGAAWFRRPDAGSAAPTTAVRIEREVSDSRTPVSGPSFDRGMFTVPVNGRVLRWAFMPPYLNVLGFSGEQLAARRGWTLTANAIRDMQRVSRSFGGELVVMFVPFKSQVYLPLLDRTMSRDELRSALQFSLDAMDGHRAADLDAMRRNRLALNVLMRRLCEEAAIPFLDTTELLAARVALGENVYFPDESHLNEIGEAVLADALADFLRERVIR